METVKIFGLPRTCTNITEILIKTNFECTIYNNFPCWKHGLNTIKGRSIHEINEKGNKIDIDDLKFVICTKHPYNWLWSLWNFEKQKPYFCKRSLDQFLNDEYCFHYRDKNPIKVFNKLTHNWLTMQTDPRIIQQIKNEDMIDKQEKVCQRLMNLLNLNKKKEKFYIIEEVAKPGQKLSNKKFEPRITNFTKKQIKLINSILDYEVVKLAGYEI